MSGRWEQVLDVQLDLWKFWAHDPRAPGVAADYVADRAARWAAGPPNYVAGAAADEATFRTAATAAGRAIGGILDRLPQTLFNAEPCWVEPDMLTLVEHAAGSFQPEPLIPPDLITPIGFVYLPRPLYLPDIRGRRVSVRAFAWSPIEVSFGNDGTEHGGIALVLFSEWSDADDYHHGPRPDRGTGLQLLHATPWVFDQPYPAAGSGITEVARIIQCFWRISSQTLATRVVSHGTSPFRRRLERARFPEHYVTVIHLRRPAYHPADGAEPREVEWSHRWLVGGHWRAQPYPSLGIHRQVWISPYIKGPEDKPLVIRTARAFELVR